MIGAIRQLANELFMNGPIIHEWIRPKLCGTMVEVCSKASQV